MLNHKYLLFRDQEDLRRQCAHVSLFLLYLLKNSMRNSLLIMFTRFHFSEQFVILIANRANERPFLIPAITDATAPISDSICMITLMHLWTRVFRWPVIQGKNLSSLDERVNRAWPKSVIRRGIPRTTRWATVTLLRFPRFCAPFMLPPGLKYLVATLLLSRELNSLHLNEANIRHQI